MIVKQYIWNKDTATWVEVRMRPDIFYGTTSGTNTAYTLTIEGISDYYDGLMVVAKFHTASGASASININGIGTRALLYNNANTTTSSISANDVLLLVYDATTGNFRCSADKNTTYTNMTASHIATGTSTTGMRISPKVLKDELDKKVDTVAGKGLSTNDYTTAEKNKLAGIAAGAEVNVQADWSETNSSSDAFIKNKPTIPAAVTVINNLTSTSTTAALAAAQGKILKDDLDAHKGNTNNPHGVTASQIGLGLVFNYSVATQTQAQQGTINTAYMTPLRTAQAIAALAPAPTAVIDNLTSTSTTSALSANQGKILKDSLDTKVDKVAGKGLSTNDYTTADKNKISDYLNPANFNKPFKLVSLNGSGKFSNSLMEIDSLIDLNNNIINGASEINFANGGYISQVTGDLVINSGVDDKIILDGITDISKSLNFTSTFAVDTKINGISRIDFLKDGTSYIQAVGASDNRQIKIGWSFDGTENNITLLGNELSLGNKRITGVDSPYAGTDAVNKQWVDAHTSDTDNPHGVTKAQVGLGSVLNYGIANQTQAQQGTANNAYMTPLRTAQAIAALAPAQVPVIDNLTSTSTTSALSANQGKVLKDSLDTHTSNTSNPHGVTAYHVGLGWVKNYDIATQAQATAGTANNAYMTPLRTAEAIAAQVTIINSLNSTSGTAALSAAQGKILKDSLDAHTSDTDNPHGVTASQIGLGAVFNYGIASQSQATAGTINNAYMTPLRTAQAIAALAPSLPGTITKAEITSGTAGARLADGNILKQAILELSPAGARPASSVSLSSIETDMIKNTFGDPYLIDNVGSIELGISSAYMYLKSTNRPNWRKPDNTTEEILTTSSLSSLSGLLTPVRTRGSGSSLTAVSAGSTILASGVTVGDSFMMEVNSASASTYNPKIISFTVGRSSTGTSSLNHVTVSWVNWNGSDEEIYSFVPYISSSNLYIRDFRKITRSVSGSTMTFTTTTPSIYVGRIWKL